MPRDITRHNLVCLTVHLVIIFRCQSLNDFFCQAVIIDYCMLSE